MFWGLAIFLLDGCRGLWRRETDDSLPFSAESKNGWSCRLRLKCDGTRTETRIRLSGKRTSKFKSAMASVHSTTGSRGFRISGINAGCTMFRGSVRVLATHSIRQFPLLFPSRESPCAITFQTQFTSARTSGFMSCTGRTLLVNNLTLRCGTSRPSLQNRTYGAPVTRNLVSTYCYTYFYFLSTVYGYPDSIDASGFQSLNPV